MRTIHDLDLQNKKVFVRTDLNVPLNEVGEITDLNRITSFLPTLKLILSKGGIPILCSHLGRPKDKPEPAFSLAPVAKKLNELCDNKVQFAKDCIGPEVQAQIATLKAGDILLLENVRFHPGEEKNDLEFAKQLAIGTDVYINDAFATAHRAHASTAAIAGLVKEKAAGLLMQKELDYFKKALVAPEKPLCVVLGGAKVSGKFATLLNIADKADKIIIGGAMANTFIAAQGLQVGRSLCEPDLIPKVIELIARLSRNGCKLYLPVDFLVSDSFTSKSTPRAVPAQEIPADTMALDIGPASSILFQEALTNVATIVWNGPMGAFENELFANGTNEMTKNIGSSPCLKVAGGGDTVAAISSMELEHKFDYISTGGGAFLELMEGKVLPGVKALED